ncbi:MAG: tRNA 4-thiouridine(8) synthase ThiI [Candidatus Pacearchaeota archaeon]
MKKALVLLSDGLDSRLACKILQEQLEVEAVFFALPFISKLDKKIESIKNFCKKEKIKLYLIDVRRGKIFEDYIEIVKKPRFSRGVALNPCIDCHIFLFKEAKKIADKRKIKIIASGEVLGERPLSQTRKSLKKIDEQLGFEVLRPLSAKLLPETTYEREKLVDREKFFSVFGRRRKTQFELARKYKISFPHPGGGCLLCEKEYCKKLYPLLKKNKINFRDIQLLSIGRNFFESNLILGRNEKENKILEKEEGIKIIPTEPGPTALIRNKKNKLLIEKAKCLIKEYSKKEIKNFIIK